MPNTFDRLLAACAVCMGAVALLASCAADAPTGSGNENSDPLAAVAGKFAVCHRPGSGGSILEVGASGLADHVGHGDYVTTLLVSHGTSQPGDGVHFSRIGDALDAAKATRVAHGELLSAACRITIAAAAGTYQGTIAAQPSGELEHFPLTVDVPDITLRGALAMGVDGNGRATGTGTGNAETTLRPAEPLPFAGGISTPIIIVNAHPTGSAGHGLTVEGFVFQSGHDPAVDAGGQGVLGLRASGLTIRGNRFEGGFTESIDLRGVNASVVRNHLSGTAGTCDVCLAAPGRYLASDNRLLAGGIPGIGVSALISLPVPPGIEPLEVPATAEVWADVRNNAVSDHTRIPTGVGLRVDAIGVGAPNVHNTIHATFRDNLLVNNRFGIIIHAAFPLAGTDRTANVDVSLGGNTILQSCQAKLLVSLGRHLTALGLDARPYLQNSTFQVSLGGDLEWSEAWFGHPDGFGNTLVVDGETIGTGSRQFYDAVGCPGA